MVGLLSLVQNLSGWLVPNSVRGGKSPGITQRIIGETEDGAELIAFTLTAPSGLSATWLNYGATLQTLVLPDGTNIVAGFEDPLRYLNPHPFMGCLIGPVANRISEAGFTINGNRFETQANHNGHTLHSGSAGFQYRMWDHAIEGEALGLFLDVEDGDGGFPGNREVSLIIQLADNALRLEWAVETDADTPINLTHHSYFNMGGDFTRPIDGHALQSEATHFSDTDDNQMPTGQTRPVAGTPFDFTDPDEIGPRSLDHNLLVPGDGLRELAAFTDGERTVFVNADTPGLQVFSGESLTEAGFVPRAGLALEPQWPPDAVNQNGPDNSVLKAGETRYGVIEYILHGPGLPR